jgi:hypothetical protein
VTSFDSKEECVPMIMLAEETARHERAPEHCEGCGRPGYLIDAPIFDRSRLAQVVVLEFVGGSVWPDGRKRALCSQCREKLYRHTRRLAKAATGWGYLT